MIVGYMRTGKPVVARTWIAAVLAALLISATFVGAVPAHADDIRSSEYWLKARGISEAHKVTKGKGVKVAIIDTGIDTSHPDLKGTVTGGADMSGSGGPQGDKPIGVMSEHGTLVATLLGGRGNNKQEIERVKSENERLKTAWEKAKKHAEDENKDKKDDEEKVE
ncbi:MAG: S8 family serine peptidase, partial [Glutamicibacter ardleyensis]